MHEENTQSLAGPHNPTLAGLGGDQVDLVALDFSGQLRTAQPKSRSRNQGNNQVERIGQRYLYQARRGIVPLDGEWQSDDAEQTQDKEDVEDLGAHRGPNGLLEDSQEGFHGGWVCRW